MPPQTPEMVDPLVKAYIESEFAKLNSKNTLTIEDLHGGKPWVADYKHWNYEAAKRATEVSRVHFPPLFLHFPVFRRYTTEHLTSPAREALFQ